MGPRAGLDRCGKLAPTGIRSPDCRGWGAKWTMGIRDFNLRRRRVIKKEALLEAFPTCTPQVTLMALATENERLITLRGSG